MEHCTDCGTCTELFDHHCDILNVCISCRTFKYFTLFFFYLGTQMYTIAYSDYLLICRMQEKVELKITEELLFAQVFSSVFGTIMMGVAFGFLYCTVPTKFGEENRETDEALDQIRFLY